MTMAEKDVFVAMYYMRKVLLMREALRDDVWSYFEQWKETVGTDIMSGRCDTLADVITICTETEEDAISDLTAIEKEQIDEWRDGDYDAYTSIHYGNAYWNEIEMDFVTSNVFDRVCEILGVDDASSSDGTCYCLDLYDFNNASIFFESEKEIEAFIDEYDVAPCTAFKLDGNQYSTELWSI